MEGAGVAGCFACAGVAPVVAGVAPVVAGVVADCDTRGTPPDVVVWEVVG